MSKIKDNRQSLFNYNLGFVKLLLTIFFMYLLIMLFIVKPTINFKLKYPSKHNYVLFSLLVLALTDKTLNQEELVKFFKDSNAIFNNNLIDISITKHPLWKTISKSDASKHYLQSKIGYSNAGVQVSYKLPDDQWLNYSEKIINPAYIRITLFFIIGVLCLILILFYSWTSITFMRPMRRLKRSAHQLGVDINTKATKVYGPAIIKETSYALIQMQARIKDLVNHRTRLLAAISHDIRTPITRLKLKAHLIEDPALSKSLMRDFDEIEEMVSGILNFAKNDSLNEKKTQFDICSLLFVTAYEFMDMGHDVTIKSDVQHVPYLGSRNAIKRCFMNLIQNAIKYAGSVAINFLISNDNIIITFKDNGPGIAENELKHVFKPFYRANAGKKKSTGVGLGLSVVHEVIHAHSATIEMRNRHKGGLAITISLPKDYS